MAYKSGNYAYYRLVALSQTKLLQQLFLADLLAAAVHVGVVYGNVRVGLRIVNVLIYTVEESAELVLLLHKYPVQTVGIPGVEYLPSVAGRNGGHLVGALDSRFHKVYVAVVLQQVGVV